MRGVLRSARTNCAVDPLAPLALALALAQTLGTGSLWPLSAGPRDTQPPAY